MFKNILYIFTSLLCFMVVCPTMALAYIDPGVGSMILQGLAAAAISALVLWRGFKTRIKDFFSGGKKAAADEAAGSINKGVDD